MAKDPAVLFYTSDFLTGATFLNMEERGLYITLLCMQHQQGGISEKDMLFMCQSRESRVFGKFYKEVDGLYYNRRMKEETEKRKAYSKSRSNNRKKKENPEPKQPKTSKSYVPHMENEDENINEDINEGESPPPKKEIVYPFDSPEFMSMWDNWKEYKDKEFKYKFKSDQSQQAALSELANKANGVEHTAIEILKQSMANGWKGFFAIKSDSNDKGTGTNGQGRNNSGGTGKIFNEDYKRELANRMAGGGG